MRRALGWFLYGLTTLCMVLLLLCCRGVFLPCGCARSEVIELDDKSLTLVLAENSVSVRDGSHLLWQTESSLHIQDFLTLDIDRDGQTELMLLAWRRGNYGSSRPFWVERNDTRWSQHIFIYKWQGDAPVPQWMSSRLRPEVDAWAARDGSQLFILTPEGEQTLWQWGNWGLVRVD